MQWREAHRDGGRGLLCFHPDLEGVVFLLELRVGSCQVLDSFLMISFCFDEFGGLGLKVFDAGGQTVHDVGFLVSACHIDKS